MSSESALLDDMSLEERVLDYTQRVVVEEISGLLGFTSDEVQGALNLSDTDPAMVRALSVWDELNFDSIDLLELTIILEARLRVEYTDESLEVLADSSDLDVGDLVDLTAKLLLAQAQETTR